MNALLRLMTWLSPAFPVGGFSYSHGLERAVEAGLVSDRASLIQWVETVLRHGAGRSDAALLLEAMRAHADADRLDRLVDLADAMRGSAELALESSAQGTAFVATIAAAWPDPWLDQWRQRLKRMNRQPAYAVAVGVIAARAEIAEVDALLATLQAFAANLVSAAIRLVPLGQTDGQKAMAALEPVIEQAVHLALTRPFCDLGSATAMVDWCSLTHETQYTRLFRS
ncbi:urease accessory protein UreF [Magnetospirillum gryphiswaldense]|uniref:Urease accessory protein UreF n=1 Tax=Magnetospirillum gryphiswaldense TaxID=55518 RepID=A4U4V4_9PROT|nr:urease accessory protein UreF [Magnetospirillum gryphiswaldense]AVM72732.1 Urease accessory protein UreF [Magnetospirillum gryphiswaldense MSR-1]AVM76635.1 Urease accessory protein UreF [Magnetospirillum gryphiswaldense]CAM77911.1 Urease accessory protein [Magnetospirillum gryphiswaldense MSR-1]